MPRVMEVDAFTFHMYPNDHPPPHVHVFNADGECIINLGSVEAGPEVQTVIEMRNRDVVRAYRLVERNRLQFLARWRVIHGS